MSGKMADFYKPIAYGLLNVVSASGIVFANKAVMTTFGFKFIYALTLLHTLATLVGMKVFAYFGMYEKKKLPKMSIASLAAAYVGYIVLNNLNLQMNTVGFYQKGFMRALQLSPDHAAMSHRISSRATAILKPESVLWADGVQCDGMGSRRGRYRIHGTISDLGRHKAEGAQCWQHAGESAFLNSIATHVIQAQISPGGPDTV